MYYQINKNAQVVLEEQRELNISSEPRAHVPVDYKIINVVAMGTLTLAEGSIDLAKIEAVIPVKHPNYFPCVMFKVEEVSILVFKNGKIILTAIKHPETIPVVKQAIEDILLTAGIKYTKFVIEIQNLVAMANLGRKIDLAMTCLTLENCLYEPEQFSGAIVRNFNGQSGAFLVFNNSKIIYLGSRSLETLNDTMTAFVKNLYESGLVLH